MIFIPFSYISSSKEDLTLQGDTGEIFVKGELVNKLGDEIKVRVVEVNHETRSIVGAPAVSIGGLILPDPDELKKAKPTFKRRQALKSFNQKTLINGNLNKVAIFI